MLILKVVQKTYPKDSNWRQASVDESKVLIVSVDLEDDDVVPVREDVPGEWFFTRDFTMLLYDVYSDARPDTHEVELDFAKLEALKDLSMYDSKELRYWLNGIEPGTYTLLLTWEGPDRDGEYELAFGEARKID